MLTVKPVHLTTVVAVEEVYGYILTLSKAMVQSEQTVEQDQVLGAEVLVVGLLYTFKKMSLSHNFHTSHMVEGVDLMLRLEVLEPCSFIIYTTNTVPS